MSFKSLREAAVGMSQALTVTLTQADIRDTIELEAQRTKYYRELNSDTDVLVACPAKGYCASCPVANAAWRLTGDNADVYDIEVDGTSIATYLTTKPKVARSRTIFDDDSQDYSWWYQVGVLPFHVTEWIGDFDAWLKHGSSDQPIDKSDFLQELLNEPDTWPLVPAPFTVTFERMSNDA